MGAHVYRVEHATKYEHAGRASTSQHVAHLRPRDLPHQRVHWHTIVIDPVPANRIDRVDYFGNAVQQFAIVTPYSSLLVTSRSLVEVLPQAWPVDPSASTPWEEARDALRYHRHGVFAEAAEFSYGSHYANVGPELAAFARETCGPGQPVVEAAVDLMHRIHAEFTFDAGATTIATPVTRVLSERRGVCQDFAHLQIACLRSLGLAARYVSGYLLTDPPPGQPRLTGADASHAWLSVHCPRLGWIDIDPTNDVIVGVRHITLGWGRDYGDVSPLRGVVLGGGEHALHVGVSVTPVDRSHAGDGDDPTPSDVNTDTARLRLADD